MKNGLIIFLALVEIAFLAYMLKFLDDVKDCTKDKFRNVAQVVSVLAIIMNLVSIYLMYVNYSNKTMMIMVSIFFAVYNGFLINFMIKMKRQCDLSKFNETYDYITIGLAGLQIIGTVGMLALSTKF